MSIFTYIIFYIYVKDKCLSCFKQKFREYAPKIIGRNLLFGLIVCILIIPITFFFTFIFAISKSQAFFIILFSFLLIISFIIIPIAQIHFSLTNVHKYGFFDCFKETFRMLKGKWINTLFIFLIFFISHILFLFITDIIIAYFITLINNTEKNAFVYFIISIPFRYIQYITTIIYTLAMLYQYGYLITNASKLEKEEEIDI